MFLLVNLNEILVSMQKEYKYNSYKYLSLIIIHIIKFWTDVTASVLIIFYLLLAFSKTCTGQGDLSIKKKSQNWKRMGVTGMIIHQHYHLT